jgi:glycosyltransferase involved in cell wall biosynthesis
VSARDGTVRVLRVLRVLTRPNVGGPMRQAVALWHAHRALGVRTLLVVGRCAKDEPALDLARTGIPRVSPLDVQREGTASEGVLELPALRRAPHPWRDVAAARALRAIARLFRPHVLHTHTSKAGWLGRRALPPGSVEVVAHTYHGHVLRDYFPRGVGAALRRIEVALARRTDLLFAVSPSCRAELAELGVAGVRVLPPAVDGSAFAATQRSAARRALGLDDSSLVLGFVGRLVAIKRPELFAEAVRALPGAIGCVFGAGPAERKLAGAADGRVRCLGVTLELPRFLAGLDALLVPSRREGCPLAAVEAFAAGVPVVGFDVPGVRDALAVWGEGVLVPEGEGGVGLARATAELLADAARRDAVVARARAGLARFSPDAVARELVAAYDEKLGRSTAAQSNAGQGQGQGHGQGHGHGHGQGHGHVAGVHAGGCVDG